MQNPYKKITASLLLFSHMLTSCYNPNMGMGKQALPTPADPADKQGQYEGEPHDKYPQPTNLIFTTGDNHPITFTFHNGQWQAEVEEHAAHGSWQRRELPVVFEPGLMLEDVVSSNPTEQKLLLHLCASEEDLEKPGYVYVGRAPIQAKPHPQLLSSPAARQTTPPSEVGPIQQQATTQPQQVGSSPQQAQEEQGRQAVLVLPSPVQQIGEGPRSQDQFPTTPARVVFKSLSIPNTETPRQRVTQNQSKSAQRGPSRKALSWRNQNKLLHSQRAAQTKRQREAAIEKVSELAQPAQPRPAIIPPRSLAHKTPEGLASHVLLAQGGHPVRFMHQDGQWQARVREPIGVFSHVMTLPVACEGHGDIEAALLSLQEQPARYTQCPIRVMHTQQIPYVPKFVYLGEQVLKGGMDRAGEASGRGEPQGEPATGEQESPQGREPSQSASPGRGVSVRALQARMAQGDIKSTAVLVKAFNAAQAPEEQEALQQWIQRYIAWFNDQTQHVGNLVLIPAAIQEYTSLAHIQADRPANRQLLASYFNSLCNKIDKEYQHGEEPLIEALEYTLQNMDSRVFEGDPSQLITLGKDLLAKLDPSKTVFSEETYPTYRSTLYALHQTLGLIKLIAPGQWKPNQAGGLYQRFRQQCKAIAQAAQYYPIRYHARLLKQSLQHLEGDQSRFQDSVRPVGHGLEGMIYLYQGVRPLADLGVDLGAFKSCYEHLQEAFTRQGIGAKSWYDSHQLMHYASLLSLENANEYGVFERGLQTLKDKEVAMDKEEDRTALRFGIVQQLRMLALHGPTSEVRKKSIQWLSDLAQPEAWGGDPAVMEGLLDSLAEIAKHSQGGEEEQAREALASLTEGPAVDANSRLRLLSTDRRKAVAVPEPITQWLGGQRLEEKLSALPAPSAALASGGLFRTIHSLLRAAGTVEPRAPAGAQQVRQALRDHYQHLDFVLVPSLFEGEASKHVDSLQCQLMLLEQVKKPADREGPQDDLSTHHERLEWVKNPIALEDLFQRRSTKPGEAERGIQKVLLVGEPGTGKTTLSRKLAYRWAQGKWGEAFEAVYVLPVRALQQSEYDNVSLRREVTLATAIANHCFAAQNKDEAYERLRDQISEELERPTTLVVLDGLDERYGASEALLGQAKAGSHKLLMLSRPYGIEQERPLVDLEIEHVGFSDGQMQDYVRGNLSPELGEELLQFIKEYPAIASIAHVPVNLQILCALWQDNQTSVRKETRNGSLPGLYRRLTEYIWERYTKQWGLADADCDELFDTLGKIALDALQQGEVLISPELVRDHVEVSRVRDMLKDSGFLFLQSVGRQYQFPHLTFQEYFAGRSLARQLLSGNDEDQGEVQAFFTKHQYEPQYGRMLSFLAGEVSKAQKKKGVNGIRQVLSLLEAAPQEVVGVQHVLLQMRLLNEWLCIAGEDWEAALADLEEEFHVMDSLKEWFGEGLNRVRRADDSSWDDRKLLGLLTTGLQGSRAVAAHALAVLQPLIAACKDDHWNVRSAASQALGQVGEAVPAHALAVLEPLIAACKDEDEDVRSAARSALDQVVQAAPAEQVLQPLRAACKDSDADVRSAASSALGQVGEAAPAHALAVLEPLIAACKDSDYEVRSAASQALGQVGKAAPAHALAVLEPLIAACKDSDYEVRSAASQALGQVGKAAPAHTLAVLEPLIAACKDSDYEVRSAASQALGQVGEAAPAEQVLQPLIAACNDSASYVRSAASSALGQVGKAAPAHALAVLQPLIAACNDSDADVRSAASQALGQVGKAAPAHALAVLQPLIAACNDSDYEVRSAASQALGQVGATAPAEQVLQPLIAACNDSASYVRSAASSALGQVVQAAPAEQVLQPLIAACKDDHWNVRRAASYALGQVVKAAPAHALAVLQPLIAACKDDHWNVRRAASYALGQVGKAAPAEQVLQPLIAACNDSDADVRSAARSALGQVVKTTPAHALAVLQPLIAACNDSASYVRLAASQALGQVGKAAPAHALAVLQPLIAACKDSDSSVRRAASSALGQVGEAAPAEQVLQPLIAACKDDHSNLRRAASSALGQVGKAAPAHALAVLQPLIAACNDSDADVRSAASSALLEAVKAAPDLAEKVLASLREAVRDSDADVRSAASSALLEAVKAAPDLAEKVLASLREAMGDDNWRVRRAASSALVSLAQAAPEHAPALVEPLLAACKDSWDWVRSTASSALGQVVQAAPDKALEALKPLIEACKDSDEDVRSAASQALGRLSLQQLMEGYWTTQNQALIPFIVTQLYHTPLLVRNSPKPHHQRLVLHPTAGRHIAWDKPQQDVQRFVQQIKSAAKQ